MPLARRDDDPLLGRTVAGKFRIEEQLATGAFGSIYRATQLPLGRPIAFKVLQRQWRTKLDIIDRFEVEARLAAMVSHPNVVEIFDFGESDEGLPFLAMELLDGETLRQRLAETGTMSPGLAASIIDQMLAGLDAAHGAGVVHGDVKPANVVLRPLPNGGEQVKLIDFGVASSPSADEPSPRPGLCGTPTYMAPETVREVMSPASDLYAAGVMLYELVFGDVPFNADQPAEILRKHLEEPVPTPEGMRDQLGEHAGLWSVIERALAKDERDRFASAQHMRSALAAALGRDGESLQPTVAPAGRRNASRPTLPIDERKLDSQHLGRMSEEVRDVRRAIGEAIVGGNSSRLVDLYLEEASLLASAGDRMRAAEELEEAIDLVTAGAGASSVAGPPDTWRLVLRLAEIERDRGRPDRARDHALAALERGLAAPDPEAAGYARAVLRSLSRREGAPT